MISPVPALASPAPAHFSLADTYGIVGFSAPRLGPDGRTIVFVRSTVDLNDDSRPGTLQTIDIASGTRKTLVATKRDVADPEWSPDGAEIAFVADDAKHRSQVWTIDLHSGAMSQVTDAAQGVDQYAWSPSGVQIAYVTSDQPDVPTGTARWQDAFRVTDNAYLATGPALPSHLYVATRDEKHWTTRRLTAGTWSVASGAATSTISWSPDASQIAFVRLPNALLGDADRSVIETVDVRSGALRDVTGRTQYEYNPRFAPHGTDIAYTYARDDDPMNEANIFVTGGNGAGRDVSRPMDANAGNYAWYPDGSAVLVAANSGTRRALWKLRLNGVAEPIALGDVNPFGNFDGSIGRDGTLVFVGTQPQHPAELYVLEPGMQQPRALTDDNARVARMDVARVTSLSWGDTSHEDGVLTYPVDYDASKRYPLVLLIHGGPTEASVTGFDTLAQLMAARGWFVLEPNYRGSDNLGNAYQHSIFRDPVRGPASDILDGVAAAQRAGSIDAKRICVSGWSYGGMLTSWLITQDHRWACAVAGAAVDDLTYDYALADDVSSDRDSMGGSPFLGDAWNAYRDVSPLTYVEQVTTPTLLLADVYDVRVPTPQTYAFYRALHDRNVPVEFDAWPVHSHFPGDPVRIADVYRHWMDWIAAYVAAH